MMRFLMTLIMSCLPTFSMAYGHVDVCKTAVTLVSELVPGLRVDASDVAARDADGWCNVPSASLGDVALRGVAFRIDDTDAGLDLDMAIDALELDDRIFEIDASFAFVTADNVLTIRNFAARSDDRYGVEVSGQMIMGDQNTLRGRLAEMAVQTLLVEAFATPEILRDLGLRRDDVPCIGNLAAGSGCNAIDRQSRRELTRFSDALPNTTGRFDIRLNAPSGKAIAAIIAPFIGARDADIPNAIGRVLSDDLQITLRWNPGRM